MSSSRATIAAGTRPPRVTAMMPFQGLSSCSRQARALALRCSSSHDTGKVRVTGARASVVVGVAMSGRRALAGGQHAAGDAPRAVGLTLHEIERGARGAVGPDDLYE